MSDIIVPGREYSMKMSLKAFHKIAEFILRTPMKAGDKFTIEGTDKKKLVIFLEE